MAVLKCKMCGGDIQFNPGGTYGKCEYCGSVCTIPTADDDQKLMRYNRANHYRRQGEFDKALAVYERILEEDDTDAEAHWGAVLSRYGIEYVEDPGSGKRIPTCHRVQLASILADDDYKAAIEHAPDTMSRSLYEAQAAEIAEIQKGMLAVSAKEKPYDVFICYKETDENSQRTRDSQWAQDVYYGLTDQGYKVFFSRITLEDKLGQQYEPYIFAALNSAKVMVVIGSKPEYFNAVWVKNEWSRYLAIMANDRGRLLIPCYRDMDPYDLPEELRNLQSQDMGKIGFMQDLLRGVKKVLDADRAPEVPKVVERTVQTVATDSAAPGVASLLKRVHLFLEDGDFSSASDYIDRVLDIDPECSEAYVAKVCAKLGLRQEAQLASTTFLYDDDTDWKKAVRFANDSQKSVYEGYLKGANANVSAQLRTYAYDCAFEIAMTRFADRAQLNKELSNYTAQCKQSGINRPDGSRRENAALNEQAFLKAVHDNEPGDNSEKRLKEAAAMFDAIGEDKAKEYAQNCRALAEQARQKAIYQDAMEIASLNGNDPDKLSKVAGMFRGIPDYKDALSRAEELSARAEELRLNLYNDALKAMKEAGEDSKKWQVVKTKLSNPYLNNYKDVASLRAQAEKRFAEAEKAEQQREAEAVRQAAAKKKKRVILAAALVILAVAAVILVTKIIIPGGKYSEAIELRNEGKFDEAVAAFTEMGNFKDAETQVLETRYQQAQALKKAKKYVEAVIVFNTIKGYKDVDKLLVNDDNLKAAAAAKRAQYAVGKYVTMGTYPQTKSGTDSTSIEWLVLDVQGDRVLLISRYALDCKPYNTKGTSVTWETCTLRSWLNNEFYNKAFSATEKATIVTSTVRNENNPNYGTKGGNDTQDKVFLLSIAEAEKYFSGDKARMCAPTSYAVTQGAYWSSSNKVDGTGACWWWLRSPGYRSNFAASVDFVGGVDYDGLSVDRPDSAVRPVVWVQPF